MRSAPYFRYTSSFLCFVLPYTSGLVVTHAALVSAPASELAQHTFPQLMERFANRLSTASHVRAVASLKQFPHGLDGFVETDPPGRERGHRKMGMRVGTKARLGLCWLGATQHTQVDTLSHARVGWRGEHVDELGFKLRLQHGTCACAERTPLRTANQRALVDV